MKLFSAIMMAVGSIIGAGIFSATPVVIKIVGGQAVVIGYICGAIFLLFKEMPGLVMTSALPANGQGYMHASRLAHPFLGMQNALSMLMTGVLKIATLALTFSEYFCKLFPALNNIWVAAICVIFFTITTMYGLRVSSIMQNISVVVLLIVLALYVVLGFPHNTLTMREVMFPTVQLVRLWAGIDILHGSLYGANVLMYISEELENPRKNVPLAYLLSTLGCAIFYCLIGWVTIGAGVPWFQINNLADVAETFMPPVLLVFFITGGALLAVITSINAVMLMFSRSNFAAARDGFFPKKAAEYNKHGAPVWALWMNSIIALIFIFGKFNLMDVTMITSIPGTLFVPFGMIPIFIVMRKYPLSYKKNFLKTPHWAACLFALASTTLSFVMGISTLIVMGKKNWMSMVAWFGAGTIYAVARYYYMKSKGVNLIKTMGAKYQPWERQEQALREAEEAKKAAAK